MGKRYDLEDRTQRFAEGCWKLIRTIPLDIANVEDAKQLARSSGSVAANYIDANEAISKKDFTFRLKICRKEAKESRLWLNLFQINQGEAEEKRQILRNEATELIKIFNSSFLG